MKWFTRSALAAALSFGCVGLANAQPNDGLPGDVKKASAFEGTVSVNGDVIELHLAPPPKENPVLTLGKVSDAERAKLVDAAKNGASVKIEGKLSGGKLDVSSADVLAVGPRVATADAATLHPTAGKPPEIDLGKLAKPGTDLLAAAKAKGATTIDGKSLALNPGQTLTFEWAGNQIYNIASLSGSPAKLVTVTTKIVKPMTPGQLGDETVYKATITLSKDAKPGTPVTLDAQADYQSRNDPAWNFKVEIQPDLPKQPLKGAEIAAERPARTVGLSGELEGKVDGAKDHVDGKDAATEK
jgi:hypothetical protein